MAPCTEWLQIFPLMVFNSTQTRSSRALERREATHEKSVAQEITEARVMLTGEQDGKIEFIERDS
jgi:hypothetical protein